LKSLGIVFVRRDGHFPKTLKGSINPSLAISKSAIHPRKVPLGNVKATWKYSTGTSSKARSSIHRAQAYAWHFGQCQLPGAGYAVDGLVAPE